MDINTLTQASLSKINTQKTIRTIDMHTGGEPLRIIVEGYPKLRGKTILEKRNDAKRNYDHIRKQLMYEPRGHADMYGAIIIEAERDNSDFGVLFIHNEGYSTMCGHAILALARFAVDMGFVKKTFPKTMLKIDTPAGQVTAFANLNEHNVLSSYFYNVPSFVESINNSISLKSYSSIQYDIAFGGAYYAYVDSEQFGLSVTPENVNKFIEIGREIKSEVSRQHPLNHPYEADLSFLYGTIFIDRSDSAHSKNCCIFADGEVDRSPTGTGVSGRLALHYHKEEIKQNEVINIESILGSSFNCSVEEETEFGEYKAIIPKVEGAANYSSESIFCIEEGDLFPEGFLLR